MNKPTLLVLAAGIGSRYGGLKQIDPVGPNGELIIDYSVYDAIRAGFGKVVFIIRKDIAAEFKEAIGNRLSQFIKVDYAFQELDMLPDGYTLPAGRSKPWGTAHAILSAKEPCPRTFCGYQCRRLLRSRRVSLAQPVPFSHLLPSIVGAWWLSRSVKPSRITGTVSRGVCQTNTDGYLQKSHRILQTGAH